MFLQRLDGLADTDGIVGGITYRQARRQSRNDFLLDALLDRIHHRDGIGAAGFDHAQAHGRAAVVARQFARVFQAVLDPRHVLEINRRALAVGDHELVHGLDGFKLGVELDQQLAAFPAEKSARQRDMFAHEGVAHLEGREIEGVQAFIIEPDADGALDLSADEHVTDTADGLEPRLDDLLGVGVELLHGAVALQRQPDDGRGAHLDLAHHRRVGIVRQPLDHRVHLGLDLLVGDIEVLVEIKLDADHRCAQRRTRHDRLDPGHLAARLFDDVGDILVDDIRIGALHGGGDRHRREIDFGEPVEAEAGETDDAEQDKHQAHHQGEHMALDRKFRQRHAPGAGGVAGGRRCDGAHADLGAVAQQGGAIDGDNPPRLDAFENFDHAVTLDSGFYRVRVRHIIRDDINHGARGPQHDGLFRYHRHVAMNLKCHLAAYAAGRSPAAGVLHLGDHLNSLGHGAERGADFAYDACRLFPVLEIGQGDRLANLQTSHDIQRKRQTDINPAREIVGRIVGIRLAQPGFGADGAFRQRQIARDDLCRRDIGDIFRRFLFFLLATSNGDDGDHKQDGPEG